MDMDKDINKYRKEYERKNLIEKISQYSDLHTKEQLEGYSINELLPIFNSLFIEIREKISIKYSDENKQPESITTINGR